MNRISLHRTLNRTTTRVTLLMATLVAAGALSACAPLLIGGAMAGGALLVTDRRTSGTQLEDQTIELKARNRMREVMGDRGNVSITSYGRLVLLTGQVPAEADKGAVEQAVSRVESVQSVVNELEVGFTSSASVRSNDLLLTSKVKATLIDARDLQANAFKVTTERGVVYLLGMVTEREATRAVDLTRTISGVQKVVRVFNVVTEAELANLQPRDAARPAAPRQ
jgi:osmotically-inducible protein OsmY